jgi:hypothetical protein
MLLSTCQYLRHFLADLKLAEQKSGTCFAKWVIYDMRVLVDSSPIRLSHALLANLRLFPARTRRRPCVSEVFIP